MHQNIAISTRVTLRSNETYPRSLFGRSGRATKCPTIAREFALVGLGQEPACNTGRPRRGARGRHRDQAPAHGVRIVARPESRLKRWVPWA